MNLRVLAAAYAVGLGLLMGGMWSVLLGTGQVPELQTASIEIGLHLAAEGLTAVALLVAGFGLLRARRWATSMFALALGMVLYTVVNSAGYYGQLGEWPMVGFFGVLGLITVALGWAVITGSIDGETHDGGTTPGGRYRSSRGQ